MILRKGAKSLTLIELRISKIDFYFGSLNIRLNCVNFKKLREKSELTKSKLTKLIKICLNSSAIAPFDRTRPSGRQLHTVNSKK